MLAFFHRIERRFYLSVFCDHELVFREMSCGNVRTSSLCHGSTGKKAFYSRNKIGTLHNRGGKGVVSLSSTGVLYLYPSAAGYNIYYTPEHIPKAKHTPAPYQLTIACTKKSHLSVCLLPSPRNISRTKKQAQCLSVIFSK